MGPRQTQMLDLISARQPVAVAELVAEIRRPCGEKATDVVDRLNRLARLGLVVIEDDIVRLP